MESPTIAELAREYLTEKMSLRQLGQRYGCSHTVIRRRLLDAGVPLRTIGVRERVGGWGRPGPVSKLKPSFGEMRRLYERGWSLRRLGLRYDVHFSTIQRHLLALGVELRPPGRPPGSTARGQEIRRRDDLG